MACKDPIMHRMKTFYEKRSEHFLFRRMPVIGRLDGIAFSNYTKLIGNKDTTELHSKIIDDSFVEVMNDAALALARRAQGAQILYIQSDEISIFLHDYKNIHSEAWLDYNINKLVSHSASKTSNAFTLNSYKIWGDKIKSYDNLQDGMFDARFFNTPESDVNNYFYARQLDAIRNSVNMFAQSMFSMQDLHGKSIQDCLAMMLDKGFDWHSIPTHKQRGRCVVRENLSFNNVYAGLIGKWVVDDNIPLFNKDTYYIEQFLKTFD